MKAVSLVFVFFSLFAGLAARPLAADDGWVPLGPPGGSITQLVVHPRNAQLLWAVTPYGMYKSVDGGASWHEGLRDVKTLAVAPSDPDTVYALTGVVPVRVNRSSDGGRTWTVALPCGDQPSPCCGCVPLTSSREIVVDPRNPQTVFAASSRGVFKSVDGGAKWRKVDDSFGAVATLVFQPQNPSIVFAGSSSGVFKSTDGGDSWAPWGRGGLTATADHLAIDPRNPSRMWVGSTFGGLFQSTDGGVHWKQVRSIFGNSTVSIVAVSHAAGAALPVVWAGNFLSVYRSLDGGATWAAVLPNRQVTVIATHPSRPDVVWAGTQQSFRRLTPGIYKSVNRGTTWRFSSAGIFDLCAMSLDFDPVTPGVLWATCFGVYRSADGGATWTERSGNLPGFENFFVDELRVDPHDPQTLWAGTNRGVYVSEDGGATWEARRDGLHAPGAPTPFVQVIALRLAPSNPVVAYAADLARLFRTVDAGRHWTLLASLPPLSYRLLDVLVDPRDPDVVFVAGGEVRVSRDGGATWDRVPVGNGTSIFRALAADPRNPDVLYAGGEEGVFRSTDGGHAWQLVAAIPITWQGDLAVSPAGGVWAGDIGGIYFSPDGVSGWTLVPGIAPYTLFLEADPHDPSTVFAGTSAAIPGGYFNGLFRHTGD